MILDYDQLMICGPVFPHEVIGFSGGAKYFFPGIAGPDIINATHWLGALVTSMKTIGIKETPVRRVVHRAAELVPRPILCIALVVKGQAFHGMYIGDYVEAWSAAADLSAQLEIVHVPRAFKRVLSMPSKLYDDLWTAAKAMYKTEPAIADGGEVVIYAPHLTEVSYTHGKLIDEVGYHVRDYFVKQPERFASVPGMIKAHSTHVKGSGDYDASSGVEEPRIQVTLATGIPEARCRLINLGYLDYRDIDPEEWVDREDEGLLTVRNAGEMLYRAADLFGRQPSVATRVRPGAY
jgi:nickel-dependent lactate racemase